MRVVSVVGTRPQLIKEAALQPALRRHHEEIFVDTGQHYDRSLAGDFFAELGLPAPHYSLGIAGDGQVGRMVLAIEPILRQERPDAVLVYGDTNSTLAGALAGTAASIPVAHVEAGLRSHDWRMPEENIRVLVDHLSRWLFAPTASAVGNLAAEGIADGVVEVGDVMQDLLARQLEHVRTATPPVPGQYIFATLHRAANREPDALRKALHLLGRLAGPSRPVVLALHPGTAAAIEAAHLTMPAHVIRIDPVGYRASLVLQYHAAAVVTDSGGIQREAAWLGVPCIVLRETSEWEGVTVGLDAALAERELGRLTRREVVVQTGASQAIAEALEK